MQNSLKSFYLHFLFLTTNENENSARLMDPDTRESHGNTEMALHPGMNASLLISIRIEEHW